MDAGGRRTLIRLRLRLTKYDRTRTCTFKDSLEERIYLIRLRLEQVIGKSTTALILQRKRKSCSGRSRCNIYRLYLPLFCLYITLIIRLTPNWRIRTTGNAGEHSLYQLSYKWCGRFRALPYVAVCCRMLPL